MVKTETRSMEMHRDLLMQTIKRQAGTLQKANLEGVMNAIEAGSPEVRVDLSIDTERNATLSIHDDGVGIDTKEDLIKHFETFGTPHDENELKIYGQFRMGRGQMFAFGKNVWRTATFMMVVDIDNKGLTYELTENLPYVKGCQIDIDLYVNPIGYSHTSIEQYKECITEQVKFMEGRVLFNGEQINTPASKCNWDFEDDNSYYMFNIGTHFQVYNLGAFVMNASMYNTGMAGIIVSKKQLKVNFARNDVQHDCLVYNGDSEKEIKGIIDIVKENRIKKTRKARRNLNTWERIATLKDFRDGTQNFDDIKTLSLIPTAQGKHISLDVIRKMKQQWCFAPMGDRYADKLIEREQSICISEGIIADLGYTGKKSQFFTWLTNSHNIYKYGNNEWENIAMLYVDFEDLCDGISDTYHIIPAKKYTASERRVINVLQEFNCWNGRQILLGCSDTASGWTDGSSYICIDKHWLGNKHIGSGCDIADIMLLLAHEMAHDDDSRGTHIHGPEFYENMVTILESGWNSPISHCASFKYKMERSRITVRRYKEQQKQKKVEQKVKEKLGLVAKSL